MRYVSFTESKLSLLIIESLSLISSTHEKTHPQNQWITSKDAYTTNSLRSFCSDFRSKTANLRAEDGSFFQPNILCLKQKKRVFTNSALAVYVDYSDIHILQIEKKHDDISLRCDKGMFLQHRHGWWFSMEASLPFLRISGQTPGSSAKSISQGGLQDWSTKTRVWGHPRRW